MTNILLYTQQNCRFSDKAKQLLQIKKVAFNEKDVSHDVLLKREMIELSGGRVTTPQIFVNGSHIGGCDDLFKYYSKNENSTNSNKKKVTKPKKRA